jgi:hypothetical protein
MTWFEVLVEGASDVPVVREVMQRRFGLVQDEHFRIYPHEGRGKLPENLLAKPLSTHRQLLQLLPQKLRAYGKSLASDSVVLVVLDVDNDPCTELLTTLNTMLHQLPGKPARVVFRLAIEETESWFIADTIAVKKAFPKANIANLRKIKPDTIVGAWEKLAEAIGRTRSSVARPEKIMWAEKISSHLNLDNPASPSLRKLIEGIERELAADKTQ